MPGTGAEGSPERRMEAIYAWTEDGGEGEGVIGAVSPLLGNAVHLLQQSRRRDIAERLRPVAEQHRQRTGHTVRLVRFTRAEDIEELP